LRSLRQAVRRQEHDRARRGQARRQALDVPEFAKLADVIKMCEDCRVSVVTEEGFDPYGAPARPKPRTTDDYLRERESKREQ